MTLSIPAGSEPPAAEPAASQSQRRVLSVACGAHVLHDGYTDLVWIALPIWQAEFALSYAAVGALRMIYSGTLASLQIPASMLSERLGGAFVLAVGTALSGACYAIAGFSAGLPVLVAALFLGGIGAATQHPIASALVTRSFAGARSLKAFGTYNFAGDVGKVLVPASATALLLLMPWRPAYALLGVVGILAGAAIFLLTPHLAPEQQEPPVLGDAVRSQTPRLRFGFGILLLFGIAESLVRGAFFVSVPFLLIGKGATVTTAGFALTLIFLGGAAGKLACGWVAQWIGTVAIIAVAQTLTAAAMLALVWLPLAPAIALLPLLGIVLNGVTTVIYGSVPGFVAPGQRTRALSLFYTATIGSAAVAPPLSGLVGDLIGIPNAVIAVSVLAIATIPLAFLLRGARGAEAVDVDGRTIKLQP